MKYIKNHPDAWIALALAAVVFLCSMYIISDNHSWGDDFAAYILEGQAIANGTVEEQVRINLIQHPSPFYSGDIGELTEMVYVWGYPLVLSVVYKLFGSTMTLPQMIFLYKIPHALCLALMAAIAFLLYARRFRPEMAAIMALMLMNTYFAEINIIHTDLFFTCFSLVSFYLYEIWREKDESPVCGILLGISLWYVYVIRLNGISILALVAGMHGWSLFRKNRKHSSWWKHLIPYAVMGLLSVLVYQLLPVPTSNMNDVGQQPNVLKHVIMYAQHFSSWIYLMMPYGFFLFHMLLCRITVVFGFWGYLRRGILGRDFAYAFFIAASVLVASMLPYFEMGRYVMNLFPLMLLFIGYGARDILLWIKKLLCRKNIWNAHWKTAFTAAVLIFTVWIAAINANVLLEEKRSNDTDSRMSTKYALSDPALEMYQYIRDNVPEGAQIACRKPRILSLATEHICFNPELDNHKLEDAEYFLNSIVETAIIYELTDEEQSLLEPIHENELFALYRVIS